MKNEGNYQNMLNLHKGDILARYFDEINLFSTKGTRIACFQLQVL